MAISLTDARQLPDVVLSALRLRALRGIELGFRECDLADLLGVSRSTICHWWTAYQEGGLGAVPGDRTGRPQGAGRALSDVQAARVQTLIDAHTPGQLGIRATLWGRRAVRDLIRNETGVTLPVRTVGKYLRRWGYTAKRPTRRAKKQDPEEVRAWLEETYPALEKRATREGAEIFWCDEAEVAADESHRLGYARKGEPVYLPRRSPERNPDEYLNNDMKGAVNDEGLPDSQDDLRSRVAGFMCELIRWPGHVMDYLLHPCVLCACGS